MGDPPPGSEEHPMKLITAVIEPDNADRVEAALKEAGVTGLTITAAQGFGHLGGEEKIWRGSRHVVDLHPKVRFEMVVAGREEAQLVVNVLAAATRTGRADGGKVWVGDVDWVVNLRTGAMNLDAI
jgi:nitrogen regulatory protein P-II 1